MPRRDEATDMDDSTQPREPTDRPVVYIVDDDPLICKALTAIIRSAGWQVAVHGSAESFLSNPGEGPGCVLLDMRMPGMSGFDCLIEIKKRGSVLPVVMVTAHADVDLAVRSMKNGALDFLEKPVTATRVLEIVGRALEMSHAEHALRENRERTERLLAALTPRERQVLQRITRGEINKAVAKHLGISEKTVEVHRARVMSKLNAKTLADLIRIVRGEDPEDSGPQPAGSGEPGGMVVTLRADSDQGKKRKSSL